MGRIGYLAGKKTLFWDTQQGLNMNGHLSSPMLMDFGEGDFQGASGKRRKAYCLNQLDW